jgi:hypothetical protein
MGKPGEVIEIILDGNGLTGYISTVEHSGSGRSAKDVALTYFFDDTELAAKTLNFTTHAVHGKWYSFNGTIARGNVAEKTKEGYYLLQGTLTLHMGNEHESDRMEQPKKVSLPLARSFGG